MSMSDTLASLNVHASPCELTFMSSSLADLAAAFCRYGRIWRLSGSLLLVMAGDGHAAGQLFDANISEVCLQLACVWLFQDMASLLVDVVGGHQVWPWGLSWPSRRAAFLLGHAGRRPGPLHQPGEILLRLQLVAASDAQTGHILHVWDMGNPCCF